MSTFKNSFAVLKEINDKKKTIVITDKPKAKKPVKVAKPAVVAETTAPAVVSAPATKAAKAAPAKAAAPAPVVNAPPKNSLAELKEQIKRAKAEEAAKAAAPKVEEVVEAPAVEAPVAEEAVAVEGEVAAVEGEVAAVEGEAVPAEVPVPEAPKLTLAEFQKLREERLFVVKKEARRVDPTSVTGFVALNAEPAKPAVKKVEPAKPVAPVKAPAKGAKATALPTPAPAPKAVPKEKKEKTLSLGEFVAQAPAGRNFRPRRFNNDKAAAGFNAEDAKQFPSL